MEKSIFLSNFIKLGIVLLLFVANYYLINVGNIFLDEQKQLKIDRNIVLKTIFSIIVLLFVYFLFNRYSILLDTLYTIMFSLILAYLLSPIVKYFEELGFTKSQGILIVYFIIILIITILLLTIIPSAATEIKRFINNAPYYLGRFNGFIESLLAQSRQAMGNNSFIGDEINKIVVNNLSKIQNSVIFGINKFITGIISAFSTVIAFVLTPIVTFYLIKDQDEFKERAKLLIPQKYNKYVDELGDKINLVLSDFVRGRLIMALYVGVASTIVLLILRVEYAIVIGFIVGVADIVPYIGPFLGFVPALFFASLDSTVKGLATAVIFVLLQWTENNILGPKVLGDNVGLHPLVVLLSIIIGGGMFGVIGMIVSVPIVGVATVIFKFIKENKTIKN